MLGPGQDSVSILSLCSVLSLPQDYLFILVNTLIIRDLFSVAFIISEGFFLLVSSSAL